MKNKLEEYDDGHSIVDMSEVERPNLLHFRPSKNQQMEPSTPNRPWEQTSLTGKERFWYILGTLKAALLIALAYIIGLGSIILLLILLSKYAS